MSPKNKATITDRVTATKAKAYINGVKEIRKLAAVKKTNIYLEKYMAYIPKNEHTSSITITITSALMVVFRLTLFVLYLYMVWSFINN